MQRINWQDNIITPEKTPRRRDFTRGDYRQFMKSDVHKRLDASINNKYKGHTAWIFGSGASLNDIHDWNTDIVTSSQIKTIALNGAVVWFWNPRKRVPKSGIADGSVYRNRLDYWFTFDKRVVNPKRQPEWDYCNLALRHPTATKYILNWFQDFPDCPNVIKYNLRKRRRDEVITKKFDGSLITGDSILSPVLHWCYMAGFRRIYLSGIDLCVLERERYFKSLHNLPTKGAHITGFGKRYTAPNGDKVMFSNMYQTQLMQILPVIRYMQENGVEFYKTSLKGMIPVNAITDQQTMLAIENGQKVRYA